MHLEICSVCRLRDYVNQYVCDQAIIELNYCHMRRIVAKGINNNKYSIIQARAVGVHLFFLQYPN